MKEYWVNVYTTNVCYWYGSCQYTRNNAIELGQHSKYRLHVREFETKEDKELYLKNKYGREIKYNKHWNIISPKYVASREYADWMTQ